MASSYDKSVLFICLGNICRSPIAESVLNSLLEERGLGGKWLVDSAAIGPWHIGSKPDPRAISALRSKQMNSTHKARQLKENDYNIFDYILGMDDENIHDIERMKPKNSKAKIELLGSYDPAGETIIEDPYYTQGEKAFHKTVEHCKRSCEGFLKAVL